MLEDTNSLDAPHLLSIVAEKKPNVDIASPKSY